MRTDELGSAIERRVAAFVERGDAAAVLDPAAMAEVGELWTATAEATGNITAPHLRAVAMLHMCRYQATGDLEIFNGAMNMFERLFTGAPEMVPDGPRQLIIERSTHPEVLYARARSAMESFQAGAVEELEPALDLLRRAAATAPPDAGYRASIIGGLAVALCERFELTGSLDDLDEAIDIGRTTVDLGGPGLPLHLSNLGVALRDRYFALGADGDLDESVRCAERAVDLARHSAERLMFQAMLALSLRARGELRDVGDLDRAVSLFESVVAATPPDDRRARLRRANLRSVLTTRHEMTRDRADLDRMIVLAESWLEGLALDSPRHADAIVELAEALRTRYQWTGDPADLHAAIATVRRAADRGRDVLGDLLRDRYERFADAADLDEAITVLDAAVADLPDTSPGVARLRSAQAMALRVRYEATHDAADLDRAVGAGRSASTLFTPRHTDRLNYLTNLAGALASRYRLRSDRTDLLEAVQTMRDVIAGTPRGHQYWAGRVGNLASLLEQVGDGASVDEAVELAEAAAAADLDRNRVARRYYLHRLGTAYSTRFNLNRSVEDLRAAVTAHRAAARDEVSAPRHRLVAAGSWLEGAAIQRDWPGAVEAAAVALDLLPRAAWRGLDRIGKERVLRTDGTALGTDAAAVAVHASRPRLAVELAERGRSIQWSQLLDTRGDLTHLDGVAPHLAARLTNVAALLAAADRDPTS